MITDRLYEIDIIYIIVVFSLLCCALIQEANWLHITRLSFSGSLEIWKIIIILIVKMVMQFQLNSFWDFFRLYICFHAAAIMFLISRYTTVQLVVSTNWTVVSNRIVPIIQNVYFSCLVIFYSCIYLKLLQLSVQKLNSEAIVYK